MLLRSMTFVASLALLAACGVSYQPAPGNTPSPMATGGPTPSAAPVATLAPQPTGPSAEIEILVAGGAFDGAYRAVAANGCDSRPAQNTFTVTYANDLAADGFVALSLVLRDAALAQEDESEDFAAQISLNGAAGGVTFTLDPQAGQGEGSALLDIFDGEAALDLSADAPDGALIDLTVICEL